LGSFTESIFDTNAHVTELSDECPETIRGRKLTKASSLY